MCVSEINNEKGSIIKRFDFNFEGTVRQNGDKSNKKEAIAT